ncbi:hypothetical protein BV898_19152 [Hypsibius exemplaris]|uniref:Uncharacterized protein n=1 Tax=Hypsibius exemplaris TaxID=2072580 RepID=A0A9X6RNU4_HYPEX|nr:hypothetical protein BV898_19152 [Hypsibius exemplaris]
MHYLSLDYTQISVLNADLFNGFSNLWTLNFLSCGIESISPDTLQALAAQPDLFIFGVVFEEKLTKFPWEVLAPVAASLRYVSLSYNDKLANIDLSSSTATVALPMLEGLTCTHNPALQTLPQSVLETLWFQNVTIEFTNNGNVCDGCYTRALIDWVRAGPSVGNSRFLSTSCSSPNGDSDAFSGSTAQWLMHTDPNCDVVITSPTTVQLYKAGLRKAHDNDTIEFYFAIDSCLCNLKRIKKKSASFVEVEIFTKIDSTGSFGHTRKGESFVSGDFR